MHFPHVATVKRLTGTASSSTYTTAGSTKCFVQPLDAEAAELYSVVFTKGSVCYLPFTADVKTSDRVTVDGESYSVRGVMTRNYGSLKHKKAILEQLQ